LTETLERVLCPGTRLCRAAPLLHMDATEGKQILDETDLKRVILDLEGQIG